MEILTLLRSPMGPSLVLAFGALLIALLALLLGALPQRWQRRPVWLSWLALGIVTLAALFWLELRFQEVVPVFSRAWQPLYQSGAHLYWVGDGWNWYVAGLALLAGGLGVLLNVDTAQADEAPTAVAHGVNLSVNLGITAAAVLFVSSGNLLTVVITWVLLDLMILVRGVASPGTLKSTGQTERWYSNTRGLSLAGAVLVLMSLLPAGPSGPNQALQGGSLPFETLLLLLAGALLRTGIYPFHFWLLPDKGESIDTAERLLDHIVPVLTGLWLVGWAIALGGQSILQRSDVLTFLVLSMLVAAFAAFITRDTVSHTTFVFVAAAGQSLLAAALFHSNSNPAAMLWPATSFALGGSLWLVGRRIWQAWGWQLPVSVGALALAGAPFTPGFLMQPSFASLLDGGTQGLVLFTLYVVAQGLLIAALLRSWGQSEPPVLDLMPGAILRLLIAVVVLAAPLALAGFLPSVLSGIASIAGAIPPEMGTPPSVVAEPVVWLALLLSLGVGMGLVYATPRLPGRLLAAMGQVGSILRLDWLYQGTSWGMDWLSQQWGAAFGVLEGPGYMGWMLALALLAYLLVV